MLEAKVGECHPFVEWVYGDRALILVSWSVRIQPAIWCNGPLIDVVKKHTPLFLVIVVQGVEYSSKLAIGPASRGLQSPRRALTSEGTV